MQTPRRAGGKGTAAGGTRLEYVIVFGARIPGAATVAARVLERRIAAALVAIDASLRRSPTR